MISARHAEEGQYSHIRLRLPGGVVPSSLTCLCVLACAIRYEQVLLALSCEAVWSEINKLTASSRGGAFAGQSSTSYARPGQDCYKHTVG